jgi:hypothetical protein
LYHKANDTRKYWTQDQAEPLRKGVVARRACFEAYGDTISGIPFQSPHLQQTIGEALELMASSQKLMRIENKYGKAARHLPLVKAELRQLNAAEYIIIEKAICLALK